MTLQNQSPSGTTVAGGYGSGEGEATGT